MRRKVVYSIIIIMLALTGCTIGGSFYMLNFSLTPNAKILSKDADSYPFMYKNYPFLRPWVDSLRQVDALHFYHKPTRHTTTCVLCGCSPTYQQDRSHCTRIYG